VDTLIGTREEAMKKTLTWMIVGMLAMPFAAACGGDDDDDDDNTDVGDDADDDDDTSDDTSDDGTVSPCEGEVTDVTEDIDADTTWTADNVYCLNTHIFVRSGTLTIEAGTLIQGAENSSLVITTNGRLVADGTAKDPIVFTSAQAEGTRAAGDWGGVVLLGLAPINVAGGTNVIEGFDAMTEGIEYGGKDAEHDCGSLAYVRIEFAGFELSDDNELNGLTLGGCGSGTRLDYIQTHLGADDGVEFFGGAASISHLVVTQPDDDGLDWDFGWSGSAQFIIVQQNALVGNHGFEADNNEDANDAEPRSNPTIWNATLIGSNQEPGTAGKTQGGMMLRRGTAGSINNSIVAFFTDWAIDVADYSTVLLAEDGDLAVQSTYFFDNANDTLDGFPAGFDVSDGIEDDCQSPAVKCAGYDEQDLFTSDATNVFGGDDPGLTAPLDLDAPSFAPVEGSPVLVGGETPPEGLDATATYFGAIGDVDWTAGWTAYPAD
jgi:hypothetical protein